MTLSQWFEDAAALKELQTEDEAERRTRPVATEHSFFGETETLWVLPDPPTELHEETECLIRALGNDDLAWCCALAALAPCLDEAMWTQLPTDLQMPLLETVAKAAPDGTLNVQAVDFALGQNKYGGGSPDDDIFFAHLPVEEFEWGQHDIGTAWDRFLEFCGYTQLSDPTAGVLADTPFVTQLCLPDQAHTAACWDAISYDADLCWAMGDLACWASWLPQHLVDILHPEDAIELVDMCLAYDEEDPKLDDADRALLYKAKANALELLAKLRPSLEMMPKNRARAELQDLLVDSWDGLEQETRNALMTAFAEHRDPDGNLTVVAEEYWRAIETEWWRRIKRYAREAKVPGGERPEEIVLWRQVTGCTDDRYPKTSASHLAFFFAASSNNSAILTSEATRSVLLSLYDLRCAIHPDHAEGPVTRARLNAVVSRLWERGFLARYLKALCACGPNCQGRRQGADAAPAG